MVSEFIKFTLGSDYKKVINNFCKDKKVIKWVLIEKLNLNNQQSILMEYENV